MKLYEKIVFLRKRAGMSQEDLADKLSVSRQSIYKWESGIVTPEIDKIKQFAKLFDVSFDYLMDDEVDTLDEPKPVEKPAEPARPKYRFAYYSRVLLHSSQADIDHGYTSSRKHGYTEGEGAFKSRIRDMEKAVKEIGADSHMLLDIGTAACFFQNAKNMFFGFYYGGNIQFLCPYENFISAQMSNSGNEFGYENQRRVGLGFGAGGLEGIGVGSVPVAVMNAPSSHTLIITYFDKQGTARQFKMEINHHSIYRIYEADRPDDVPLLRNLDSEYTQGKLTEIIAKLNAYAVVGKRIHSGELPVTDIDENAFLEQSKKRREKENAYLASMEADAKAQNKRHLIAKIIGIGILVVAAIVAAVVFLPKIL